MLQAPFTMIVSGATCTGKTYFVSKLMENLSDLFGKEFDEIVISYGVFQPIYKTMTQQNSKIKLVDGLPNDIYESLSEHEGNKLLIIDDQMLDLAADKRLAKLFTVMRHRNLSTIFLVQNFYFRSQFMTTISRNAQYVVLFPNPRDKTVVATISRQMHPETPHFVADAFSQATSKKFGYLFIDLTAGCDDKLRLRSSIFPNEICEVYRPK